MTNPVYFPFEHSNSFTAEHVSAYRTEASPPRLTNEELSNIRRELRKLTSLRVLNATDAEDIVQDTLLTLISRCPGGELEKGPLAWSAGILRNKIGNYYRKVRHRDWREAGETKQPQQQTLQTGITASPEGELLRGELKNVIADAIGRLPRAEKTAMEMLSAGMAPKEIAAKMSPERYQAVINHLYRGRKKLALELTRYGCFGMHSMKRCRGAKKQAEQKKYKDA